MVAELGGNSFFDNDDDYLDWLEKHPEGYVVNILRTLSPAGARLHHASCRTIRGRNPRGGPWIGQYAKVGATDLSDLDEWAINQFGEVINRCGICFPGTAAGGTAPTMQPSTRMAPRASGKQYLIQGPEADSRVVKAWADDYVHFERRPLWQERLRNEIRARSRQLNPKPEQVLHATFFGPKLPNADVENLAIYNINSFREAGVNGIRFELGGSAPLSPDGANHRFAYRYELSRRAGSFVHWNVGRKLASFDWTDLGAFKSEKQLAQVWHAIVHAEVDLSDQIAPDTPFGVLIEVRAPYGREPVWGGLLKGIFDGVICALQAHSGPVSTEVVKRLATDLAVTPEDIGSDLSNPAWNVLGTVAPLVSSFGRGVKWNPSDHLCVAGELLAAKPEPDDKNWKIKGAVFELSRRSI